jgi:hypothetical protein
MDGVIIKIINVVNAVIEQEITLAVLKQDITIAPWRDRKSVV